ncbi:MAG: FISUMP domain-containing protein [Candidatus Saccharibacteria bacterium]|nr:FISUMP domain-containing protein [Candidatus Saccharibacteria bacterium]
MSKDHILLFSVATTTLLVGAVLSSTNVTADTDVVDTMALGVPQSCTMSGTGMNSHTDEIENGTYSSDIGTTTLHVFCNDNAGFAIYAVGYTDNEFGKNVLTNSTLGSTYDIITGTADSGNTSNWAMKLAINQDSGDTTGTNAFALDNNFGGYHNVPSTYTKVAHKNTSTDMTNTTGGVKLTTTYAVLISANQPAGTYTGQVKYTLVHPASEEPLQPQPSTAGCINYFANASSAVGTMGCQSASDGASVELLASNFSRTGYGFAGWSDSYDYATNSSAHFYGPQETITVPTGTTANGLSLYAVWVKSAGSIQSWNGCSSLTAANQATNIFSQSITALTDQRDSQTYAVAKLADGQCWMIENLRLESTNSDNSTGALAQGYGTSSTYGNFSGLADAESTNFSTTTANSLYYSGTQSGDASIDIGTTNSPVYRMPRYNNTNTSARASSPTANTRAMYSYGNYYTWHAAIADLTYNGTNNNSTTGTSLCPTGWHLPTGGMAYASGNTSGVNVTGDASTFREFYNLGYDIMGSTTTAYEDTPNSGYAYYSSNTTNSNGDTATKAFRKFPNNFLYSGRFNTSSAGNRGSYGLYWSSTALSGDDSYRLYLSSSYVAPGTSYNYKYYGYSIRCVSGS